MLTDSNAANQGAAVSGDGAAPSGAPPQQGEGQPGLNSSSAPGNLTGNPGPKSKSKRERSDGVCAQPDAKGEGVLRSKRRCVLEKKQPYSGDEWCSGPDTEDDEDKLPRPGVQRARGHAGPQPGNPDVPPHGPGLPEPGAKAEAPASPQTVYVFSTRLANSAAEAVLKGHADSILHFHQQRVPGARLEQDPPPGPPAPLCSGLSREQLEHRQRSLQTLRDIERLLLRGAGEGPGARMRSQDEPLLVHPDPQSHLPHLGPDLLGPEGPTPEQVAWRRLQEEFYQEKRRMQEVGGARGPPPPYHSRPGEWPLDGEEGPRGPKFLRRPLPMEGLGPQRPSRSGMVWMDDLPGPGPGPGGGTYPGYCPGRSPQPDPEPLLTREEIFRVMEKRQRFSKLGPDFSGAPGRLDHMDFPGSRDLLGPTGAPMGEAVGGHMSLQQQHHMMLLQKLRGGPQGGALPDFFSGGPMDGPGPPSCPEMFPPSGHMGALRGSGLSINVAPHASPTGPFPRPLRSPSVTQAPSPRLPSPSGPGIRSPPHMTPSSAIRSPQVLGIGLASPSVSPGHLRSPAVAGASPGWASPKTGPGSDPGPPPRGSASSAPSQNPLTLIMSQMSKYAVPSATPLYHDAIKTLATDDDDDMLPDRPLLAHVQVGGRPGNPLGEGPGPCSVSPLTPFPRMPPPPHSPAGPGFPPPDASPPPPHVLAKGRPPPRRPPSAVGEGPDLSEVIRPSHSGIPEFDLSRIMPSDRPSGTLQYFPRPDPAPPSPHLAHLQNMMAEPPHQPGPRGAMMLRTGAMGGALLHAPPGAYGGMMAPPQHGAVSRQNMMMLQAQQRGLPADAFGPQGPLVSPQGAMMTPPHPPSLRQRGMSLDGFGPGGMANMPF